MDQWSVELYQELGYPKPAGTNGTLRCWAASIPEGVGVHRRRPAVLILPGGGYEHLSQRESEPVALRFAARGWAAFALEYSVAPARHPTQLREAGMAIRYIRERAEELGVDPHMVAAVGFSAGGHLCGMLGTLFDSPEVADIAPGHALRPDALGLCYSVAVSWGPTHAGSFENLTGGDPSLTERLSLDRLVRGDMPPTCLWTTRDDGSVPCRNTLVLAQALEEAGVDFSLRLYRHGKHGLATADALAFSTTDMPSFSPEIANWPEEMMGFFAESGLKIRDM